MCELNTLHKKTPERKEHVIYNLRASALIFFYILPVKKGIPVSFERGYSFLFCVAGRSLLVFRPRNDERHVVHIIGKAGPGNDRFVTDRLKMVFPLLVKRLVLACHARDFVIRVEYGVAKAGFICFPVVKSQVDKGQAQFAKRVVSQSKLLKIRQDALRLFQGKRAFAKNRIKLVFACLELFWSFSFC